MAAAASTTGTNLNTNDGNINTGGVYIMSIANTISSKQSLLIIPIVKFFNIPDNLLYLIRVLNSEVFGTKSQTSGSPISLRLIDWFVTNYCKKYNVMYNVMDFRPPVHGMTEMQRKSFDNFIIVHTNYKGQLKAYSKRNFDPFCRRNRIRFYYEDNKYFITTVGQLNFFKWALESNIVDYVQKHIKEIEDDMNLRCENIKKPGTKIAKSGAGSAANTEDDNNASRQDGTKKHKLQDGTIAITSEKGIKTKKAPGTRKKRKEISQSASKSLSIHNFPTTLVFD